MRIEPFTGSAEEWDAFVRRQAGWTHFHLYGWRTVTERVFGHECLFYAAREPDGRLAGVLPLVRVRSRLFGHFVVSMPFVNYGGPLGTAEAQRALVSHAAAAAVSDHVGVFQIRSRNELPTDLAVGHQKLTVLVDIPEGGPDALWKKIPQKTRTKIRKPMKAGVEVRFGADQLEPFYRVLAQNMRDLGTPVQSLAFYRAIADTFGDSAWFACAYQNGIAVSGGCGFAWDREMEITWSSSLRSALQTRPGYLLHWSFLERAAAEGFGVGNFGRSTPGSGTHAYKQQYGGRDETQWWYFSSAGERSATPAPDDAKFAWGPRLWRRLPVGIATRLGPLLVRSIP